MPPTVISSITRFIRRKLQDWLFPLRMALGKKIMYDENRKIVQVSRTELIKGPCSSQELEAMLYVAEYVHDLKVTAPRVHRTYQRREGMYIAMDFVAGERLDRLWSLPSAQEQREVVEQIWVFIDKMRALPAPSNLVVSSTNGGPVRDGSITQVPLGPFSHLSDFEAMMDTGAPALDEYKHVWTAPDRKWGTCFTHADLAPRNIIRGAQGRLSVIDWEFAGWWPEYWEFVKWHFADFPELPGWTGLMDEVSGWSGR